MTLRSPRARRRYCAGICAEIVGLLIAATLLASAAVIIAGLILPT